MKCACGGSTIVKDGRYTDAGYWRRRACTACGAEQTTLEQVCETIKGNRVKQPVVAKPDVMPVIRPKRPRYKPKPKPKTVSVAANALSRIRMENIRAQKELENL